MALSFAIFIHHLGGWPEVWLLVKHDPRQTVILAKNIVRIVYVPFCASNWYTKISFANISNNLFKRLYT